MILHGSYTEIFKQIFRSDIMANIVQKNNMAPVHHTLLPILQHV